MASTSSQYYKNGGLEALSSVKTTTPIQLLDNRNVFKKTTTHRVNKVVFNVSESLPP